MNNTVLNEGDRHVILRLFINYMSNLNIGYNELEESELRVFINLGGLEYLES